MLLDMIRREAEDEDFELIAWCREVADREGWTELLREALAILSDLELQEHWRSATCVLYWAPPKEAVFPVPKMEVVARMYRCLQLYPGFGGEGLDDAENLVWSTAIALKGVDYLSDWSPEADPEVRAYLAAMP